MATNAVYKVYNGSSWVEYYFKTSAAQVGVSASRKFVTTSTKVNNKAFSLDSTGDGASVTIAGGDITGDASVSSGSLTYITASDTVAAALGKLDQAAKAAYDNIPSGILTTSNYSTTLGSVYQAKDADLTSIAGLSGTSGLLKKTAANTWALDTTSYVPSTRTVNSKALSDNIELFATDIKVSTGSTTTVKSSLDGLHSTINGMSRSYAIAASATSSYENSKITSDSAVETLNEYGEITITLQNGGTSAKFYLVGGGELELKNLHIGDSIFIDDVNQPDVWVSAKSSTGWNEYGTNVTITFSVLESFNMSWHNLQDIPTLQVSGQTVTIGDNSVTVPALATSGGNNGTATTAARSDHKHAIGTFTAVPDATLSSDAMLAAGVQYKITIAGNDLYFKMPVATLDTKNTAGSTDTNSKIYLIGATSQGSNPQTYSHNECYVGTDHCLYSNSKKVSTMVIQAGTAFSGTPATGDIWIDTNN